MLNLHLVDSSHGLTIFCIRQQVSSRGVHTSVIAIQITSVAEVITAIN